MNNVLLEGKSACLPAVCGGWIHFRVEMNENVGGNQRKRRDVFLKFVQKILEFVQIFRRLCRRVAKGRTKLFQSVGILFVRVE